MRLGSPPVPSPHRNECRFAKGAKSLGEYGEMLETNLNWEQYGGRRLCRFSTAVRQEIESLRGELATWRPAT